VTFREFFRLLGYVRPLLRAAARDDVDAMYRIQAEVNGIHAQIDARKAAR
jgi:hypothetical protein